MRCAYHPDYFVALPPTHPFPMAKYPLLLETLRREGFVRPGDLIVLTIGEPMGKSGGTNTMKIVKVGEHRI